MEVCNKNLITQINSRFKQFGGSISHEVKTVDVTLIHNWQQEMSESQLKDLLKKYRLDNDIECRLALL
jgi:hypothetical protein